MELLKRVAARFPTSFENVLRSLYYRQQIVRKVFNASEPEYEMLPELIKPGDWVIDVGANIGHYTVRFSELVGPKGRVLSFEPIPTTFSFLTANVQILVNQNVTLFNMAVSSNTNVVGMNVPICESGLSNYYQASISQNDPCQVRVLTVSLDSLDIRNRISLVKIDVEGHEKFVIEGMRKLLHRYKPCLVIETESAEVINDLRKYGYSLRKLPNSPNALLMSGLAL